MNTKMFLAAVAIALILVAFIHNDFLGNLETAYRDEREDASFQKDYIRLSSLTAIATMYASRCL